MAFRKLKTVAFLLTAVLALVCMVSPPAFAADFTTWSGLDSGVKKDLQGIWGSSDVDVFAIGKSGTVLHYDGIEWTAMSSGTSNELAAVWGSGDSDVFAVGESGTIRYYDGSHWTSLSSGTTSDLEGVWGNDGTDIFAVGSSGTILHYDGNNWDSTTSGTTNDLYGIWGDGSDVFAVGNSGTILYYDGSDWSTLSSGTTADLQGVWGSSDSDVFAVGSSGNILRFDGSKWKSMTSGTLGDFYGVWGNDGSDVFAVGESGAIAHYDGAKWSSMNRNTLNDLHAVRGFSSADVFSAGTSGAILRYCPPVIKSLSTNEGDQGATQEVTIKGLNFTGATEVNFGAGVAVNTFTVVNSKQITADITIVSGAGEGARDVTVATDCGSATLSDSFEVIQSLPSVASVSPDQDRQGVALNVTINGANLSAISEVSLGTGITVNSFTALSSKQISVSITIAADAAPGSRDVSITAPGGSFILANGFTVQQALPTLESVNPNYGNQGTPLDITISGANLIGATQVDLGAGVVVNSFTVLSSNRITANASLSADAAIGSRDVAVVTPGGSVTLTGGFTVKQALPAIASVSPDQGSQGATFNITINGTNFIGATEVRLGTGPAVNSFTVLSANQITANITIVSGSVAGVRDVSVTTPGGSAALANSFTVKQGMPAITSISPGQGSQGAEVEVIISGSNLDGATAVSMGSGVTIKSLTNLSATQIRVNVTIDSSAVSGVRDVTVTTPGGSSTLGSSFNIKEKSLGVLLVALVWVGVAVMVALFIIILNLLKKNRTIKK